MILKYCTLLLCPVLFFSSIFDAHLQPLELDEFEFFIRSCVLNLFEDIPFMVQNFQSKPRKVTADVIVNRELVDLFSFSLIQKYDL